MCLTYIVLLIVVIFSNTMEDQKQDLILSLKVQCKCFMYVRMYVCLYVRVCVCVCGFDRMWIEDFIV